MFYLNDGNIKPFSWMGGEYFKPQYPVFFKTLLKQSTCFLAQTNKKKQVLRRAAEETAP